MSLDFGLDWAQSCIMSGEPKVEMSQSFPAIKDVHVSPQKKTNKQTNQTKTVCITMQLKTNFCLSHYLPACFGATTCMESFNLLNYCYLNQIHPYPYNITVYLATRTHKQQRKRRRWMFFSHSASAQYGYLQ